MAPEIESAIMEPSTAPHPDGPFREKKTSLAAGGAVAIGFLGWVLLAEVLGQSEPWDAPIYFLLWLPAAVLLSGFASWRGLPPWVVPAGLALGQILGLFIVAGVGALWPMSIVILVVLHVPALLAAHLAERGRSPAR
jgi:hypothetical protein